MPTSKPTLRKGASGPYVTECQEDLLKLGYDLAPYGADGKYGNMTIREVKKFQAASGLTVDGICGPMTWAALDAAVVAASGLPAGTASGSNAGTASGSIGGTASGSASSQASGSTPQALEPQRFTVHIPHLQCYEAEVYVASVPGAWMTEEEGETA